MALHDLKGNNDIVIKPADKEGSIVIMDKDNDMKGTCSQLHDGCFYQKIDNDHTLTLKNKLKLLINELQPNLQNDVLKLIPPILVPQHSTLSQKSISFLT